MTLSNKILGKTVNVEGTLNGVKNLFDELTLTNEEKAKLIEKVNEAQTELNKLEAAHRTIFVADWRPFIGWVCGVSLACFFIPQFVLGAYLWVKTCLETGQIVEYPLNADGLFSLVAALLGMAALRTYEKKEGISK